MNILPRSPALIYTASYLTEFQQRVRETSQNFVGRQFIFTAISDFINCHNGGYFTIVGVPGSGKSAILAKYATENPAVIYYSAQVSGKNQVDQFLPTVCTQLIDHYSLDDRITTEDSPYISLPHNATQGSWFLSFLLQKISDRLQPNQRLIIAIDALDAINRSSQPLASNLFYLPRYLPKTVYFLLTRRPFVREKAGLLIETPSQIFNLEEYPEQNREDVRSYIQHYFTLGEVGANLKSWLTAHHLTEEEFSQQLTSQSENNFMYLSQILPAIASGFYPQPFPFERLPPGLEAYYQSHWQRMSGRSLSAVELKVIRSLIALTPLPPLHLPYPPLSRGGYKERVSRSSRGISADLIAKTIDEDEYEVEGVLENWLEFVQQQIGGVTLYSLYHSSFRDWLSKRISEK